MIKSRKLKIIIFLSSLLLGVVVAISVILGVSLNQNSYNATYTLSISTVTNIANLSSAISTNTRLIKFFFVPYLLRVSTVEQI